MNTHGQIVNNMGDGGIGDVDWSDSGLVVNEQSSPQQLQKAEANNNSNG